MTLSDSINVRIRSCRNRGEVSRQTRTLLGGHFLQWGFLFLTAIGSLVLVASAVMVFPNIPEAFIMALALLSPWPSSRTQTNENSWRHIHYHVQLLRPYLMTPELVMCSRLFDVGHARLGSSTIHRRMEAPS